MTSEKLYKLRFPIGEFQKPGTISSEIINSWINDIERFPTEIEKATKDISKEQ
jgi:hypothetical protein